MDHLRRSPQRQDERPLRHNFAGTGVQRYAKPYTAPGERPYLMKVTVMNDPNVSGHWATLFYGQGEMALRRFTFLPRQGENVSFKDSMGRHVVVQVDQVHFVEDEDGDMLISLMCERTNE
jgi:hypothetical protein